MRFWLAGMLIFLMPAAVMAQARGQVLSLGFNNRYRPDCWTPMLVQLTSQSPDSQDYQIHIEQEDMDRDRVTYTQTVTLGGNVEGRPPTTENFWCYFRPKPVDDGLPDATDPSVSLATLNSQLKIFLCDKDGKQISTLPLTSTILNVDPRHSLGDGERGSRLILFVSDGTDQPEISDFSQQKGVLQNVEAVSVAPRDLPGNVIGYEAVDTIVWMDADANFLLSGTHTPSLEALMQWVHQGGHLIICQPAESIKIKPFEQILPVGGQIDGQWAIPTVDVKNADILSGLAHPNLDTPAWPKDLGTFKVARVPALPGAKVDEWMTWNDGGQTTFTPWLARRTVGLGAVTWVAQDLGNPALTRVAKTGWRYVWNRVFDWNDAVDVSEDYKPVEGVDDPWAANDKALDLGEILSSHGMDLPGTAAALLAIAGFFFVVYWVVAGPGIYLVLAARKKANLSWFMFGLSAVVATLLTGLLVKIVVRGPPKLQHMSFVRYAAGEPTGVIDSRFGLYIREDGAKTVTLSDIAPHEVSDITPLGINPQFVSNVEELPAYLEYQIAVPQPADADSTSAVIPYRSTLKKLQAHWVGELKGTIEENPDDPVKLDASDNLTGTLINHTGYDLWHVFLGFKRPNFGNLRTVSSHDLDTIVYIEEWSKDDSLKLDDLLGKKYQLDLESSDKSHQPMGSSTVHGTMGGANDVADSWSRFWRGQGDEVTNDLDYVLPMLTFFDLLPPWKIQNGQQHGERYEFRRYGARMLDLSPAMSAGGLVIGAQAMVDKDTKLTPLPVPISVSDTPVAGQGTTYYEFILPMDRSAVSGLPTTQPSAQQ